MREGEKVKGKSCLLVIDRYLLTEEGKESKSKLSDTFEGREPEFWDNKILAKS